MTLRIFAFGVLVCSCRDPASHSGTALLLSVDTSEVAVSQLRYEASVDSVPLFEPTLRPAAPGGLLPSTSTVRILLRDSLDRLQVDLKVTGLLEGREVGWAMGNGVVARGLERVVALRLARRTMTCAGCLDAAMACVTATGVTACGANGSACVACDPMLSDACVEGRCSCGLGPSCRVGLGADRCVGGRCACGSGPACSAGQECLAQACQCTPNSCSGCCVGSTCVTTSSSATCGLGGRYCIDCGMTPCSGGQCTSSVCNVATCPNGCCIGSSCVAAQTAQACGLGGRPCESCGVGTCDADAGACRGSCGPTSCPMGCCQAGVCQPGSAPSACGGGGRSCEACTGSCTNQTCDAPCGPSTCATGCCQAGVCRVGTEASACGASGAACVACSAGASCDAGTCVTTALCSAQSCPTGCCEGNVCRTQATATCGTLGRACAACGPPSSDGCNAVLGECSCGGGRVCGVGYRCDQGRCVCDSSTCAGCCEGGFCAPGDRKSQCGIGGVMCQNCSGPRQCVAGRCN